MKTITLRKIPPELASVIEKMAAEEGLSLGHAAMRLMEMGAGLRSLKGEVVHRDLDHLAGTWSSAEADEFDRSLAEQRRIDTVVWD